jgi:hypothetical protein
VLSSDLHGACGGARALAKQLAFSNSNVVGSTALHVLAGGAVIAIQFEWIAKAWRHGIFVGHNYICLHREALEPSSSQRTAFYGFWAPNASEHPTAAEMPMAQG